MVWQVGRERILLAGGPAALLLQVAHPLIAAGVAEHSDFRRDSLARLRATLHPTLTATFGDREQALGAAEAVGAVHRRVVGVTEADAGRFAPGTPYAAADPDLALWVHATLIHTAMLVYALLVRPLRAEERERYYAEAKPFAVLFGVPRSALPPTVQDFDRYVGAMVNGQDIAIGAEARAIARAVLHPPIPVALGPVGAAMRLFTAGLLPPPLRSGFGLAWGGPEQRAFGIIRTALRRTLRVVPARLRYWPHYRVARQRMAKPSPK
jgi:uncharacterized protein (DUF2236 family)